MENSLRLKHRSLMYITPGRDVVGIEQGVFGFLQGGGSWVQLRLKDVPQAGIYQMAKKIQMICQKYGATFIVNDHPEIVCQSGADGVHLGKMDMPVDEARKLLGTEKIIGGTANTLEDMIALASKGVDYIGLGPYRFTTTKKNLSPLVGLDGYKSLMQQFRSLGFHTPVTAIGGILAEDVAELMVTGVDGIAVSGALGHSAAVAVATRNFIEMLAKRPEETLQ